jgi:hypothetical protein
MKTYYHLYVNEEGNPNPPESMPEEITGKEIISSKSVIHIDTCIMTSGHTMGIFKEC